MAKVPVKPWMQTAATAAFAAVYTGVVWWMFEQAVRGEAFWAG